MAAAFGGTLSLGFARGLMMLRLFLVACLCSVALAQPAGAQTPAPLSFEDAVTAAERAAEVVAIAKSDVDRARAHVTTARSGYLPTINGALIYQRTLASEFDDIMFGPPDPNAEPIDLPFGKPNNWRANLQVNQPLFDGFRTREAVSAAQGNVRVSELGVQSSRATVALQLAQSYFDAVLAERQVEIAEVTLQQAEETYKETELGFKQGATPEFDFVRAEVARDNQRTLLVQFRGQRDVTLVQLRRLIGVPLDSPLQLTSKLDADNIEQLMGAARAAAGIASSNRVAVAQAKE